MKIALGENGDSGPAGRNFPPVTIGPVAGRLLIALMVALVGMAPGVGAQRLAADRIRVSARAQAAKIIKQVEPVYPEIAVVAKISGTVILHAVIATDGSVNEINYVSGPPIIMHSALDAVREWKYKPTMLNDQPLEVDTTISLLYEVSNSGKGRVLAGIEQQPQETPPTPPQYPRRIRLDEKMLETQMIKKAEPVYTEEERKAGIAGTVSVHVIVGTDGILKIADVSGPEALRQSAIDAVKQWKYKPMQLDGEPVDVESLISVVYVALDLPPIPAP